MLSTACPPIDALLDGGLEEDAITLVFGEGGSGKTNLALQCAREVVAAGAKVAYIDTEGVSGRRMEQVFEAAFPDPAERAAAVDRIFFFSPFTIAEQETMVERTGLLQGLGLIVIDSINMHYRLHIDDDREARKEKEASRSLFKQLHHLTGYARQHHVPVLVTGQVYGGEDATQPFARRVMEHLVKALVRFEKRPDGTRRATVLKHRSIEEGRQARFRIGAHGLEPTSSGTAAVSGAQAPAAAADGAGGEASAARVPAVPSRRPPAASVPTAPRTPADPARTAPRGPTPADPAPTAPRGPTPADPAPAAPRPPADPSEAAGSASNGPPVDGVDGGADDDGIHAGPADDVPETTSYGQGKEAPDADGPAR